MDASKTEATVQSSQLDDAPAAVPKRPKTRVCFSQSTRSRFHGWRGSLKLFCFLAWLLGAANLAVSIVVSVSNETGSFARSTTLTAGKCDQVNDTDMWIHLVMNIASASLFACTNYTMQILVALTRHELDAVHARRESADIGIPSLRNIIKIAPSRRMAWGVMLLAAMPLHLIYNSSVYSTLSTSDYNVLVVTEEFLSESFQQSTVSPWYTPLENSTFFNRTFSRGWEMVPIQTAIRQYGHSFLQRSRDLIFFAENYTQNAGNVLYQQNMDSSKGLDQARWLCSFFDSGQFAHNKHSEESNNAVCRTDHIANMSRPVWSVDLLSDDRTNVTVRPVVLRENVDIECRLRAHPLFWWLTTVSNIMVASCMTGMILFYKSTPLVTIGDVIKSYLGSPSETIDRSACTYEFRDFKNMFGIDMCPREYEPKEVTWWRAIGFRRWGFTTIWWFGVLILTTAAFLLIRRVQADIADTSMKAMFDRGLGSLDMASMLTHTLNANESSSSATKIERIMLANLPQLVLALTYLLYNALLTVMLTEHEWHRFGQRPTGPRVSEPQGSQRSTFFLSLPYRYALPLLSVSAVTQWLLSQSFFYAEVDLWDLDGKRKSGERGIATMGFSALALFWLIIIGLVAWLVVVVMGSVRRFPGRMPLLGASSAVIAAACHLPREYDDGQEAASKKICWGVLSEENEHGGRRTWLGFSPGEVRPPVPGETYG